MKKLNMNDKEKEKLTPLGTEVFYRQFEETNKQIVSRGGKPLEPIMPRISAEGFTEFQLWHFIELYGNHIGLARENVVSDICLYIEDEDLIEV